VPDDRPALLNGGLSSALSKLNSSELACHLRGAEVDHRGPAMRAGARSGSLYTDRLPRSQRLPSPL